MKPGGPPTTSNDGSRLLIGNTVVVDNDGLHSMMERSGSIGLKAGRHAITVLYFHGDGPFEGLEVRWQGPSLGEHTGSVLAELGFANEEIERLRREGAVQ